MTVSKLLSYFQDVRSVSTDFVPKKCTFCSFDVWSLSRLLFLKLYSFLKLKYSLNIPLIVTNICLYMYIKTWLSAVLSIFSSILEKISNNTNMMLFKPAVICPVCSFVDRSISRPVIWLLFLYTRGHKYTKINIKEQQDG